MTPKEKAKEIFLKFFNSNGIASKVIAKKDSFLAVEEMRYQINKMASYWNLKDGEWYRDEILELDELKSELEKL